MDDHWAVAESCSDTKCPTPAVELSDAVALTEDAPGTTLSPETTTLALEVMLSASWPSKMPCADVDAVDVMDADASIIEAVSIDTVAFACIAEVPSASTIADTIEVAVLSINVVLDETARPTVVIVESVSSEAVPGASISPVNVAVAIAAACVDETMPMVAVAVIEASESIEVPPSISTDESDATVAAADTLAEPNRPTIADDVVDALADASVAPKNSCGMYSVNALTGDDQPETGGEVVDASMSA